MLDKKKNRKQSLLWEVKHPKQESTSYLFGTMHVKDLRAFIWQDILTDYIDKCEVFAAEFNLDDRTILEEENIGQLPEGQSLDTLLGERKYKRLAKILKKSFKVDIGNLTKVLPLFMINMLTEKVLLESNVVPLDTFLWQYASNQLKEMTGIETVYEQIDTLKHIPISYQLKNLMSISKNPKRFRKDINKLMRMYMDNDLLGLFKKSKKSLGKQRKLLLYNRNKVMAERSIKLIESQTTFIAIGAAHLPGEKGVLRKLSKYGLVVKPILLSDEI